MPKKPSSTDPLERIKEVEAAFAVDIAAMHTSVMEFKSELRGKVEALERELAALKTRLPAPRRSTSH